MQSKDFFFVVAARHSIRAFADRLVEPDKIRTVLEAADRAPSAGNLQAYKIHLVTSQTVRRALAEAALSQSFIAAAPAVLVFSAHPERSAAHYGARGASLYALQDATIACAYAQLAATALGLASVWVGAFEDDGVRAALGVGEELRPVAILPIGYAAEAAAPTPRRPLTDLVQTLA